MLALPQNGGVWEAERGRQITSYVQELYYAGVVSGELQMATNFFTATSTTPTSWFACTGTCNELDNEVQSAASHAFPIAIPYWKATSINLSSAGSMVISQ